MLPPGFGSSQEVPSNYRRFLAYGDAVWWVESGEGAIFAMERTGSLVAESGELDKGPLSYLGKITEGTLIFGFDVKPEDHIAILLITHSKMKWSKISIADLYQLWKTNAEFLKASIKSVTAWINQANRQIAQFAITDSDLTLRSNQELIADAAQIIAPFSSVDPEHKDDLIWIEVLEGEVGIFGLICFKIAPGQGLYPLTKNMWLAALTDVKIRSYSTDRALIHANFIQGMQQSQYYLLEMIHFNVLRRQMLDEKRMEERARLDSIAVDESLRQMAAILQDTTLGKELAHQDSLLRACQLVGENSKLNFVAPPGSEVKGSTREHLKAICEASKVAMREVKLTTDFWKQDALSLVAFDKETRQPLALIRRWFGYELWDPDTLKKERITKKNAYRLSERAYMFYTPFTEKAVGVVDIIKTCIKGRRSDMLLISIMGILGGIVALLPPYLNKVLFNNVIDSATPSLMWQVILGLIVATVSTTFFLLTRSFTMLRFAQFVDYKLEPAVWDRILNLPARFFRQFPVGDLIQRVFAISRIHQLVSGTTLRALLSGIFSCIYFLAMLYYSPSLALIGLGIIFIAIITLATCIIKQLFIQRSLLNVQGRENAFVVQLVSGIGKLRVSGAEQRAFVHWSHFCKEIERLTMRAQKLNNIVTTLTAVLPIFSLAAIFTAVYWMIGDSFVSAEAYASQISIGTLIAFLAAYAPFSTAIFEMSNATMSMVQALPLWERARIILQTLPESKPEEGAIRTPELTGDVLIDRVAFRYDPNMPFVLNQLTLFANAGEFIAIAGPSGCGKSTLVRLLLGFERPEHGDVYYNGSALSTLDQRRVRKQIGTVLQNGAIFAGSIHDNIVCGGVYKKEEVEYALHLSGFEDDLKNMPMGLHTVVQSGDASLSGGQGQRLLIARALVSKPKILILDEATSALDNKSQEAISNNFDTLKVTRIVIAHRLSTIRNADRIYVIDKGVITQTGTFKELAAQEGLFMTMLQRQKL